MFLFWYFLMMFVAVLLNAAAYFMYKKAYDENKEPVVLRTLMRDSVEANGWIEKILWGAELVVIALFFGGQFSYEVVLVPMVLLVFVKSMTNFVRTLRYKNFIYFDYAVLGYVGSFLVGILAATAPVLILFEWTNINLSATALNIFAIVYLALALYNFFWLIFKAGPLFLWRFVLVKAENSLSLVSRFPKRKVVEIDLSKKYSREYAYRYVRGWRNERVRVDFVVYIQDGAALAIPRMKSQDSAKEIAEIWEKHKKVKELFTLGFGVSKSREFVEKL